jgi:Tfp pilus assembly protein PilN
MINLLPDETKSQIKAARANSSLIRLVIFLTLAVIFLGAACGASYLFLDNARTSAKNVILTNQSKTNSYSSVLAQANTLMANFTIAKNIMDQQVSYSKIISGLASVMPEGVILDSLTLTNDTLSTPISLSLHAKNAAAAAALKTNIQKSQLFSGYILQTLSSGSNDTSGYPTSFAITLSINQGAIR